MKLTLNDVQHDAVMAAGMAGGLYVLIDEGSKQAANAVLPMIEAVMRSLEKIADDLERIEKESRA